jgi:hypothetical protein
MDRFGRLFYGIILPPALGSLGVTLTSIIPRTEGIDILDILSLIVMPIFLIPFALMFVGFQSVIFSLVMEFIILARISNVYYVVASGCVLGILSSFIMGVLFCILGAIVGSLSSYFLFRQYNRVNK